MSQPCKRDAANICSVYLTLSFLKAASQEQPLLENAEGGLSHPVTAYKAGIT